MKQINDEIDAILSGKTIIRRKCPYCGNPLEIFINGYPTEEIEAFIRKNPGYFAYGGCCVFGDDRDPDYYCPNCRRELSYNLKQIELIYCPLVNDDIYKENCGQYAVLSGKYRYTLHRYRHLVCDKICPSIGKSTRVVDNAGNIIEGKIQRVKLAAPDSPGSFLLLEKKQEDGRSDTISIRITEISTVDTTPGHDPE